MKKKLLLIFLPLFLCASGLYAQKVITGKVTDSDGGLPLPGVSVSVKGTSAGTITNNSGEYTIQTSSANPILVFRFIGYATQEIALGNRNSINVSLGIDNKELSEVVVTALGIKRSEKSLGYSTQQVDGDDLTLTKEQNVIGSLAGKIAGVQVVGASGASMGGTQKIKIRGVNSINGVDQPLMVVDGTPISNSNFAGRDGADYGNLGQDINPEDIESVNVLKGPAASALYGLRGQYGVILITTKKGKKGTKGVDVQINSASSIERAGNFLPLQNLYGAGSKQTWNTLANGQKIVQMDWDESWGPKMDGTLVRQVFSFYPQDPTYGQETPFVPHPDNIKNYYRTGHNFNNGISVSGGSDNSTFRLSFNDTRIGGVEPNTSLKRNNLGLSATLDLSKKLTVSTNLTFAFNKAQRPRQGSEDGARYMVQWFQRNIDMNRLRDYKYDDGTFLHWNLDVPNAAGEISDMAPLYWNNPYFEAYENLSGDSRNRLFGDVGLTYQVLPELKLSGFIRPDFYTQNIENRYAFGGKGLPSYSVGKYENREINYEFLGQYSKNWNDFSFNANLGANTYNRRYTYLSQATVGGLSALGYYNIAASIDRPENTSYLLRKQIRSMYGMASIGYKDTYFLDASLRNDNSSTLPEDNNSYWYPSVSGSFVFSELVDLNLLSFGKIRASYAKAGSDLGPYETSMVYSVGTVYPGSSTVNTLAVPDNLANPNIQPSFAHSYEAGIDLSFLRNRLGINLTFYEQKNKNQIISLDVSGASGYESTTINAGLIQNKGVELTLTGSPLKSKNFSWDATFNYNRNRSMVVELAPGIDVYTYGSTRYSGVDSYANSYVGQPFGSLVGKAYQRDPATGKILLGANGIPLYTAATHNFGSALPDYTGGLLNSFRIWKINLGAMIDFQKGGQFFSRSQMLAYKTGMAEETAAINDKGFNIRDAVSAGGGVKVSGVYAPGTIINGVNVGGTEATNYVDARTYYRSNLGTHVYEEWLNDASYIKLRELSLGYTFNNLRLGNTSLSRLNLALIARNPAMIWQKAAKGLDPSELSSGSQSISWFESGQSNTVRSYGFNLNITF
ncbi:MAG: SusC/RagA family TonB-linked outer membrane protein [Sphingobacteriaceae bacterium]